MIHIQFLLPGAGIDPVGGFKVVYEYANHLARKKYNVSIILGALYDSSASCRTRALKMGTYMFRRVFERYGPATWFVLDPRVEVRWTPSFHERYIPDADIIVATAWETAVWVSRYASTKGEKFYLIQDMETWSGRNSDIMDTFALPLKKIVISRWLRDIIRETGQDAAYIRNGLDWNSFSIDQPIYRRSPNTIMALYHKAERKGSRQLLKVIHKLKAQHPFIRCILFGVSRRPDNLPPWIEYHRKPHAHKLRTLYNTAAIFLSTSLQEGWGLPPCEAMMCGCAIAVSNVGGHREFAIERQTALLFEPGDVDGAANALDRLLSDSTLRIRLAMAGHEYVKQFRWEKATEELERVFFGKKYGGS